MEGDVTVKSVRRAVQLIKLLGEQATAGWRLSDLALAAGLGKATTHRLLNALTESGFAYQDPDTRRYFLGYEIVRLGSLATRFDVAELARPALLRLARETGDTVFLSVPEGLEAVCLERQVGDFPIKTLTLDVGDRRPLGVGAGSLALLAFLPEEEAAEIIASNAARLERYPGFAPAELRRLIAEARRRGYAFNDGRIVSAMCAVGVPVFDLRGRVVAAISIAAIRERMAAERIDWIAGLLQAEAQRLRDRLAELSNPVPA
ncbi:transcriptional regulator, IclR family [Tistlia consotensis]|uniref:Transcriptional regulator, IclR family n=1 Tax=Tistlia consotensis USBA 355 TaxID=560819 RepID=A0A1Y6B7X8_9PROT|nr:IclR family transcriptional regulator [Tistlia consotensis]SME89885.1 transcriptional regulator, IclR family [Tistlia consotensis USBA 355]SNR26379.1 transcriptional regulator, IclR family [Tistlia consotensis]